MKSKALLMPSLACPQGHVPTAKKPNQHALPLSQRESAMMEKITIQTEPQKYLNTIKAGLFNKKWGQPSIGRPQINI
jgi:hypothetical protein